jgi:hypothetical protein
VDTFVASNGATDSMRRKDHGEQQTFEIRITHRQQGEDEPPLTRCDRGECLKHAEDARHLRVNEIDRPCDEGGVADRRDSTQALSYEGALKAYERRESATNLVNISRDLLWRIVATLKLLELWLQSRVKRLCVKSGTL